MRACVITAVILLNWMGMRCAIAQSTPFVDPRTIQLLSNELSGDRAFDNLRPMTLFHRPRGSKGELQVAEFIAEKAKEYGIEDVKIIHQHSTSRSWTAYATDLWITAPSELKLASYAEVGTSIADYSRAADVSAELIDAGTGLWDEDYASVDVKGKIVLASGAAMEVMRKAVWERGAAGIVSYYSTRVSPWIDGGDQIAWQWVPQNDAPDGAKTTFAFILSPREGMLLHDRLVGAPDNGIFRAPGEGGPGSEPHSGARSHRGETIIVHAVVDARFTPEPEQWLVEGYIRGTERHDQQVMLTAHMQEGKFSANDDGSGCVSMLEIGRTLEHLIGENKLARPPRDIRFWWTTEGSSEVAYFSAYPDERKSVLVNINQDMVGAKQSLGSRVQHISRTPYSSPSYLSDVVENIVGYVVDSNNSFLSSLEAGTAARGSNFTHPMYSRLGTQEAYNARVVPYFDETDHAVFLDKIIGVPAVTLTNWPDEYIHSSADDLWQVDPTQIKRNAFIVAASALYVANIREMDIPRLAAEVYTSGRARIAMDERTALRLLTRVPGQLAAAEPYHTALNLIRQSTARELSALDSTQVFFRDDLRGRALVNGYRAALASIGTSAVRDLKALLASSGSRGLILAPPAALESPSPREVSMAHKIPVRIPDVAEYFARRGKLEPPQGLHPVMFTEILNFVDGRHSYLDIYDAVSAEALSVGDFQYGTVSEQAVEDVLSSAVTHGVLKLRGT